MPFATPRTRRASQVLEWFSCFPAVQLCHDLGAGSGGKTSSLTLLAGKGGQPRLTEPTLALAPSIGTVSPAPLAGLVSFATAPLHFTATSQAAFPFHSFRRSQTAETGTDTVAPGDSRNQRPRCSAYRPVSNMAARLRPAKASAIRREASPFAEDSSNSPRCFARARRRNSRGDGQLSRRSAGCACETGRPRWKNYLV